jgi:L-asparagine transporter-like permease
MIAIGTGRFLGSASRLHSTGPALLFSYALVGVIRLRPDAGPGRAGPAPHSGAFVSSMREFDGETGALITGWMDRLNWALTGIRRAVRGALSVQSWCPTVPAWETVLIAPAVVLVDNLLSARGVRRVRVLGLDPQGHRDRAVPGGRADRGDRGVHHRRPSGRIREPVGQSRRVRAVHR